MNHRRDEQYAREQAGQGRGQDDWRSDNERSGWGRAGGENQRFGGGMRGAQGQGRFAGSYGYEGVEGARPYGYGEGMFGGFSYGEEGMRGSSTAGQRRWANEGLANDFSVEGTRNLSRDEQRANARGYGIGSAFESEGGVRVSHRGKGPKGFKRSDERIREDASQLLADHHEIDASDMELTVKDGELTLSGTAPDRNTKRLAERVVESVSGVLDVHNTLRVARAEPTQLATQSPQSSRTNGNQTRTHS